MTSETEEEIVPHFAYRVGSTIVDRVIGLGRTQRREAVERGELPPPVKLTATGRAMAYLGSQLIQIQQQRLAAAKAEAEARAIASRPPKRRRLRKTA
jgi:predicted DNA-binding transcriptional regulator AlpA